jgi:hypothetical protein
LKKDLLKKEQSKKKTRFPPVPRKRSHHEQAEEAFETATRRNLSRTKKFGLFPDKNAPVLVDTTRQMW